MADVSRSERCNRPWNLLSPPAFVATWRYEVVASSFRERVEAIIAVHGPSRRRLQGAE